MDLFSGISIIEILLTGMGAIIMLYFKKMSASIDSMSQNMIEMNVKLERVITDQDWHRLEIKEIKLEAKEMREEIKQLRG